MSTIQKKDRVRLNPDTLPMLDIGGKWIVTQIDVALNETYYTVTNDMYQVIARDRDIALYNEVIISDGVPFIGFLDTFNAVAGYSVDLLRGSYSGALLKIRRSSDNAEKDFYPDTNNTLSLLSEDGVGTSLATWIGVNNGFVVTWYDQQGSNNAVQATALDQPQIVSTGVLITNSNGNVGWKPIDTGAGVMDHLEIANWHISSTAWVGCLYVMEILDSLGSKHIIGGSNGDLGFELLTTPTQQPRPVTVRTGGLSVANGTALTANTPYVRFGYADRTNVVERQNGSASNPTLVDSNTDFTMPTSYYIGNAGVSGIRANQVISEVILINTDESANISAMETEVNDRFTIY